MMAWLWGSGFKHDSDREKNKKLIERIKGYGEELTAIRRDLHAHPELGFEEVRPAGVVGDLLESWGIETHRNIGQTGVVGVIEGQRAGVCMARARARQPRFDPSRQRTGSGAAKHRVAQPGPE
jgi:hypothetical protein